MPATMMSTVQEWQDEFFDLVERVQEPFVRLAGDAAESFVDTPETPAWPSFAQWPTMSEVVENQIAFTTKFIDQQAAFARSMVKALQPVLVRGEAKPGSTPQGPPGPDARRPRLPDTVVEHRIEHHKHRSKLRAGRTSAPPSTASG